MMYIMEYSQECKKENRTAQCNIDVEQEKNNSSNECDFFDRLLLTCLKVDKNKKTPS